jgi:hypothetical protein
MEKLARDEIVPTFYLHIIERIESSYGPRSVLLFRYMYSLL